MDGRSDRARILVVEDEEDCAALLASHLKKHDYLVDVARDGVEAWSYVRGKPPDLITLDFMMPFRTGIKFFSDLRRDENLRNIPVVLITGIIFTGTKSSNIFSSGRLRPPEGYLEKPVSEHELIATVGRLLNRG